MAIDTNLQGDIQDLSETPPLLMPGQEENCSYNQDYSQNSQKLIENISATLTPLLEIFVDIKEDLKTRDLFPRYRTGLRELDQVLWGVHKRELMIIGARTSHGKTAIALQIAKNLADMGSTVVYFSLEMSKEQLVERLLSNFGKINNIELRQGKAADRVKEVEKSFEEWVSNIKFLIDDKNGYDFERVKVICEILKPDFVFVDYIQMVSTKGKTNKLEAIEEYIRCIKQLANEMNFGAVVVSQLNRSGAEDSEMIHLKGSGTLEEHPDTVLLCAWKPSEFLTNKFTLKVAKQRHGTTGDNLQLKFSPQYSLFEDV